MSLYFDNNKLFDAEGHLTDEAGNVLAKDSTTMMLADRARVEAASQAAVG